MHINNKSNDNDENGFKLITYEIFGFRQMNDS